MDRQWPQIGELYFHGDISSWQQSPCEYCALCCWEEAPQLNFADGFALEAWSYLGGCCVSRLSRPEEPVIVTFMNVHSNEVTNHLSTVVILIRTQKHFSMLSLSNLSTSDKLIDHTTTVRCEMGGDSHIFAILSLVRVHRDMWLVPRQRTLSVSVESGQVNSSISWEVSVWRVVILWREKVPKIVIYWLWYEKQPGAKSNP